MKILGKQSLLAVPGRRRPVRILLSGRFQGDGRKYPAIAATTAASA
jgi:hypothetical protein